MTTTFKTAKGEYLLCLVPSDASKFQVIEPPTSFEVRYDLCFLIGGDEWDTVKNICPTNDNGKKAQKPTIIGLVSELTEEQWEDVVDFSEEADIDDEHDGGFKCYIRKVWKFTTASESAKSLLNSLECWSENPYGTEPHRPDMPYQPFYAPYGMSDEEFEHEKRLAESAAAQVENAYEEEFTRWQNAELRTGSWLLLKKIDNQK